MTDFMRSPYPWFGGKSSQKERIWQAFGPDVPNYVEAFLGGASVLLGRPGGPGKIETVNDLDCDVANFHRAIRHAPYEVAAWCDDPVNEADMHAENQWLVDTLPEHRARMHREKYYFDAQRAGRWVWGICIWIGTGWASEPNNHKRPILDGIGKGINGAGGHRATAHWQQRPKMSGDSEGQGVHSTLPQKLPHLAVKADGACAGRGIFGHLPSLGNDRGINGLSAPVGTFQHTLGVLSTPGAPPCFEWFKALALRLRRVRVACGDFERVLGASVLGKGKNVGGRRPCAVLLDPPYDPELRMKGIYSEDAADTFARARKWAIEHGSDRELRIAFCGYAGASMPSNWTEYSWTGRRGHAGKDNKNRMLERIWFSPGCLPVHQQRSLFSEARP